MRMLMLMMVLMRLLMLMLMGANNEQNSKCEGLTLFATAAAD